VGDVSRAVAAGIARLQERALQDRMEAIQSAIGAARDEEKDALLREKHGLKIQLQALSSIR
jgi:hypothetical protein